MRKARPERIESMRNAVQAAVATLSERPHELRC